VVCEFMLSSILLRFNARYSGTGDNVRHDNDPKIPRTTKEINDLNRAVAKKMEDVFMSKGIPVVPSLGEFSAYRVGMF
jgi:endopolyphosphatase